MRKSPLASELPWWSSREPLDDIQVLALVSVEIDAESARFRPQFLTRNIDWEMLPDARRHPRGSCSRQRFDFEIWHSR